MSDDRIGRLSQRFKTHTGGRKPETKRARERQSFYLDGELVTRIDQTYQAVAHQLYPAKISKATFWEALLEYGLDHLDDVKGQLISDSPSPS